MKLLREFIDLLEDRAEYIARSMERKLLDAAENDDSFPKREAKGALKIVERLRKIDPSKSGENLQYIARMYGNKQFKLEDSQRLKSDLELFYKVKSKLQNKDLNSYKELKDLYAVLEPFTEKGDDDPELASNKELARRMKSSVKKLIDAPNFKVIVPETEEAACFYGKGTKWCTASTDSHNLFKSYKDRDDLIIIIAKRDGKDRKFQFHYESGQIMDELDRSIKGNKQDIDFLSSFPEYADFLNMMIEKHYAKYLK